MVERKEREEILGNALGNACESTKTQSRCTVKRIREQTITVAAIHKIQQPLIVTAKAYGK